SASTESGEPRPVPAKRVISAQNAYLMTSMMRDVARVGTARKIAALNRSDLAGKTGTTNDQHDAWFAGFNGDVVATVWVGFDQMKSLGAGEFGAQVALPIWLDFMKVALDGAPERSMDPPGGLVTVRIDPSSGLQARPENESAISEIFEAGTEPPLEPAAAAAGLMQRPGQ